MHDGIAILAIQDVKASAFVRFYPTENIPDMMRGLQTVVNDENAKENSLHNYPEDFNLFQLGEIDQVTGKITICEPVKMICNLKSLQKKDGKNE